MIAIDTNVLVRYLVQDDPEQARQATAFLEVELSESRPGFIAVIALVELVWVMERVYRASADAMAKVIGELLATSNIVVEQGDAVRAAMQLMHGDLSDRILHEVAKSHGCDKTVTFDRAFARLPGVELLKA